MKKKIYKIWSVGLVLVIAVTLLLAAAPVSAAPPPLAWGSESTPSTTGAVIGPAGVDVLDIAVAADGTTIYVAAKATGDTNLVYKSTNGGETWSNLSSATGLGITNTDLIAVAPDDADLVVVVDSAAPATTAVYVSTNGGTTWGALGTVEQSGAGTAADLYCVAISPETAGTHYIAVGGTEGANLGNVWYFNVGAAAPVWKECAGGSDFGDGTMPDSVGAVAFSPSSPRTRS